MSRILIAFCLTLSAALAQAPAPAAESDQALGSISGVVRGVDGAPIVDASVRVFVGSGSEAKTGADGHYVLPDLPPRQYRVSAYVQMPHISRRSVTLSPGESVTSIDFKLSAPPKVMGRVLDANGEPLPGVRVHLVGTEYQHGRLRHTFRAAAETDDQGAYQLDRFVRSGIRYAILAKPAAWDLSAVSDVPADPEMRRAVPIPTYYPRSPSLDGAERLVLRSGEVREDVDIRMLSSPSYCMEGVLRLGGRPAETYFRIEEQDVLFGLGGGGGFYGRMPAGTTAPDGKLRICGLQPGEYKITASSPLGTTGEFFFGTATVAITREDVRNISVPASPMMPVSGEVVWDGAAPDDAVESEIRISVQSLYRAVWPPERDSRSVTASIPGEFAFPGLLMDDYQLRVTGLPANVYVKDITYGENSIRHDALRLGSTIGEARLRIVLAHDAAVLDAKVSDEDGNPVAGAGVCLMPAGALSEASLAETVVTGETDQRGVYTSGALAPGKYYVLAGAEGFTNLSSPENIGKLWRARPKAQEVELAPNRTAQVTLRPMALD